MRLIDYSGVFCIVMASCTTPVVHEHITVLGQFPALSGKMLYLDELEVRRADPVDSAIIDEEGNFQFYFLADEPGFYMLRTDPGNSILLLIEEDDQPHLYTENRIFSQGYQVNGSPGSVLLRDFEMFMQSQKDRMDSIAKIYHEARGSEDFLEIRERLDLVYARVVQEQKRYIEDFVSTYSGSLSVLIVLNRKLGQVNILDEEEDFILFQRADSALMLKYPLNKHVTEHNRRVKEIRARIQDRKIAEEKVKPGKKSPEIFLPDTTGNMISLEDFSGNPIILYFWEGWNASSRQDNRRLVRLYPEWLKAGVRMLGISLDENNVIWKGAIKLDRLPWPQVSDLKGPDSPIRSDFNLPDRLPYYFLLDDELRIVYKHGDLDSLIVELDKIIL
jgi:peroxiredoxin